MCLGALAMIAGSTIAAPPQDTQPAVPPRDCNPATDDPLHGAQPFFDARCDKAGIATPEVRKAIDAASARNGKARSSDLDALKARIPALDIQLDANFGTPQWVGSTLAFLTDPAPGVDAKSVVGAFLAAHNGLFEIDSGRNWPKARMPRDFLTDHNGVHHFTFQQQIKGVDLFECWVTANVSRDGRLINIGSTMLPCPQGDFVVAAPRPDGPGRHPHRSGERRHPIHPRSSRPRRKHRVPPRSRTWNTYKPTSALKSPSSPELVYFPGSRATTSAPRGAW